ncbi:MAG: CxxC-x17-CxxC domain-containing protein [Cyanobacteriota bacterium]
MSFSGNFEDQYLPCADCGAEFVFTADDQAFYSERNYSQPKRCPDCRADRRRSQKSHRGGGGGGGGGQRRDSRTLYNVVCDGCGIETSVPFKPSGDRPVYCRDCYKNN